MLRDLFQEAFAAMKHNWRRTGLTMLGMAWGIATVVLLLAYGDGMGTALNNIFSLWGLKVIGLYPGRTSMQAGGMKAGRPIRFTLDDVDRLAATVPALRHITPSWNLDTTVQRGERSLSTWVNSGRPSFQNIRSLEMAEGRFFNEDEYAQQARVVVIAPDARAVLFSGQPALGEEIRIGGITFLVIGVLQPKPQEGENDINRGMYIPGTTMASLRQVYYVDTIWFDFEGMEYQRVEQAARNILADAHNFRPQDRRAVTSYNGMQRFHQFDVIVSGLRILLAFIGAITLGIGGVGLMNIMLVAVSQRTREIGMEKALGARKRHILIQFLAEAMTITLIGGILGIALSYAISYGVGSLTLYSAVAQHGEMGDIRLVIDMKTLVVATAILGFVGLVCGMLPAIRAANLDPIESLRYE